MPTAIEAARLATSDTPSMNTILRFLAFLLAAASVNAAGRPNILFIAVDDLRPEFGAYGFTSIRSPNLDRLAKSGITFGRAYCQQAVCSPSRSSLMTGLRPDSTRVWDLDTHFRTAQPNVVTLGQHFKQHGYFVQGMGKIYHGNFDDAPTWSVPWQTPKAQPYALPENLALQQRGLEAIDPEKKTKANGRKIKKQASGLNSRGPAFEGADVPDNTFQDGKVAELAVGTLQTLSRKSEPFFLAVGFSKPHRPVV